MRKRSSNIEWHIAETDAEWNALRAQATPGNPPAHQPKHLRWLQVLAALLLVAAAGWWWRSASLDEARPAEEAVQPPIRQAAIVTPQPSVGELSLATPPVRVYARSFAHLASEQRELADWEIARMLDHPEWGMQVYQQITSEELRTTLAAALWGSEERLETTFFMIHFRQRDAQAVMAAAPRLDELYADIQQNFGVESDANRPKLVMTVSETRILDGAPYYPHLFDELIVSSPALYPPTEWTPADLLTQSLVLRLVDHALAQAVARHAIGPARGPTLNGLRLWQLWNLALPLADGRHDLVRWLYVDLPKGKSEQPLPLPARYDALCATYTLWMSYPAHLRIPLLCTPQDTSPLRLPFALTQQPPSRLPWLNAPTYRDENVDAQGRTHPASHPGDVIALVTLFDYIVITFGQERLPLFVASLGQHAAWESLAPAVFGVTAGELEEGWQRYLELAYLEREI